MKHERMKKNGVENVCGSRKSRVWVEFFFREVIITELLVRSAAEANTCFAGRRDMFHGEEE